MLSQETLSYKNNLMVLTQQLRTTLSTIDDEHVKQEIEAYLKYAAAHFRITVVGEVNAGKSSFINGLLGTELCEVAPYPCTNSIHEIMYGEKNRIIEKHPAHRRQFVALELLKELAIVDTPGIHSFMIEHEQITNAIISSSDSFIIVVSALDPFNETIWTFINDTVSKWGKSIIFVVQQIDLIEQEQLRAIQQTFEKKLTQHDAKVFYVSANEQFALVAEENGYEGIRQYIQEELLPVSIVQEKYTNTQQAVHNIIRTLETAFTQRQQQYEQDQKTIQAINHLLEKAQTVFHNNKQMISKNLFEKVDTAITQYEKEMIQKLNPYTIQERFVSKKDFHYWLEQVNESYKDQLNKAIAVMFETNIKTFSTEILTLIEECFELLDRRVHYERPSDSFYTSHYNQQYEILIATTNDILTSCEHHLSFADCSEALYNKIVKEKKKYDLKRYSTATVSGMGTTGIILATAGVSAAPIVLGIIAGTTLSMLALNLGKTIFGNQMENNLEKSIVHFRQELFNSKSAIKKQLAQQIEASLLGEVQKIDKNFANYRKFVHQEQRKIADLQQHIQTLNTYL